MTFREWIGGALRPAKSPPSVNVDPIAASGGRSDEESLGRELLRLDWGLGILRWVHLDDAVARAGRISTTISFGSGEGLHEAFLARMRPDVSVLGVDLRQSLLVDLPPNVRFLSGDLLNATFRDTLPMADFVFSIECLEHIENDRMVARAMAERLAPGGYLYIQVPFASSQEQADPVLTANERRLFGHVRPGYDESDLRGLARELDLEIVFVAGAFWTPQRVIWAAVEKFGVSLAPRWRDILDIARLDLRAALPSNRNEAIAIKMLARRPT